MSFILLHDFAYSGFPVKATGDVDTSSHAHFLSPCQSLQHSPHSFCAFTRTCVAQEPEGLKSVGPLKESSPSTHHGCPAHHLIVLFRATFIVSEYTAHDWNQVSRKRNSAVGWIVWSSGRLHSNNMIRRNTQGEMQMGAAPADGGRRFDEKAWNSITRQRQLRDGVLSIVDDDEELAMRETCREKHHVTSDHIDKWETSERDGNITATSIAVKVSARSPREVDGPKLS